MRRAPRQFAVEDCNGYTVCFGAETADGETSRMRHSQYELDHEDRILAVNEPWSAFARENDAEHLVRGVIGTTVWDWVAGPEVRHLYRLLFSRVREVQGSTTVPFRCDSPSVRRFMELEVCALPDDGLLCTAMLKRAEQRDPVPLLNPHVPRSETLLRVCSWCKRVPTDDGDWLEIEQAITALHLVEEVPPAISHTICDRCEALFGDS